MRGYGLTNRELLVPQHKAFSPRRKPTNVYLGSHDMQRTFFRHVPILIRRRRIHDLEDFDMSRLIQHTSKKSSNVHTSTLAAGLIATRVCDEALPCTHDAVIRTGIFIHSSIIVRPNVEKCENGLYVRVQFFS